MAQAVPLVRAMALIPTLRWLGSQDGPVESLLQRHRLSSVLRGSPMRPVPLLKVGELLRDIARDTGPDAACKIVYAADEMDLVQLGRVALGCPTPTDALLRISMALPYFCSHELLNIESKESGVTVHHAYGAAFDPETLHLMSQYALAVLDRICAMTGAPAPRFLRAELPPHPEQGLGHLDPWFGEGKVEPAGSGALMAVLPHAVAARPFPRYARDRSAELARAGLQPLRQEGGFAMSVRTLLAAILEEEGEVPSLDHVADAAGLSTRTFQRRLQHENRSFKRLVDEVREERAKRLIATGSEAITEVAGRLGYSRPTSLNRSMLRWTGSSPSAYRQMKS
jgi:AraC-like DNA-binding protein